MSSKVNGQQSTIDDLIAATAQAREVIRELHGATKDLRRELKEAQGAITGARTAALDDIQRSGIAAAEDVGKLVHDILDEWLKKITAFVQCPECGLVQAILTGDGRRCECATCGHHFPRSAVLLSCLDSSPQHEEPAAG
jgi:translation initiation factor 2 beta subunit (eIF-2beta)/eIF-5